jgi:hypothetical protein
MYQTQIPGQNQQVYVQTLGSPVNANPNVLLANNQLQYQRQLAQQQNQQLLQAQNLQKLQQAQYQKNQLLNAQKLQQAQNMQKLNQAQKIQNAYNPQAIHNHQAHQVPQNLNLHNKPQALAGQDGRKAIPTNPLQKTGIKLPPSGNHHANQNLPAQANQVPLKAHNVAKQQLGGSHLDLSQNHTLEPVQPIQPGHLQVQNNLNNQNVPTQKKEALQAQQNNQQMMGSLKNTTFMPLPGTAQPPNPTLNTNNPQMQTTKKSATLMTVNSLANLPYNAYPKVEFSAKPFFNIAGYGSNSYNGKIKSYNEDMAKTIVNYPKKVVINNQTFQPNISYFGVFDGHGGDKCSKFLKQNLDTILFNSTYFPTNIIESVKDAFQKAEQQFSQHAIKSGKLVDKSGSCALVALIINDTCYAINLGDSRALYSRDSGKEFYQITRDHKPNDEKEKKRIEKMGGKVYYANKTVVNGVEVILKEEQFGKGFTFPYRLSPSGLAVSIYFLLKI